MKIKKKLRDLTPEEYTNWHMKNCSYTSNKCDFCQFKSVVCNIISRNTWVIHKDLYSDKFLNQEIEIEIKAHDILDKKEKEYLQNVIKPFRDRVKYITKQNYTNGYDYISISVSYPINDCFDCFGTDSLFLPVFKSGTMYNNMKVGKNYTLKELGL